MINIIKRYTYLDGSVLDTCIGSFSITTADAIVRALNYNKGIQQNNRITTFHTEKIT